MRALPFRASAAISTLSAIVLCRYPRTSHSLSPSLTESWLQLSYHQFSLAAKEVVNDADKVQPISHAPTSAHAVHHPACGVQRVCADIVLRACVCRWIL